QQAIATLEESVSQNAAPDVSEPLRAALGSAYAENGQLEKGLQILKDLLAAQPDSADAHLQLGLLLPRRRQADDQQEAAKEFQVALRLDPSSEAPKLALAQTLITSQSFSEALPLLLEYTSRKAQDAQGFYALGLAYKGLHQPEAAIQSLRRAVELDSHDTGSRLTLGKLLEETGQTVASIQQLQAAERIDPADP